MFFVVAKPPHSLLQLQSEAFLTLTPALIILLYYPIMSLNGLGQLDCPDFA